MDGIFDYTVPAQEFGTREYVVVIWICLYSGIGATTTFDSNSTILGPHGLDAQAWSYFESVELSNRTVRLHQHRTVKRIIIEARKPIAAIGDAAFEVEKRWKINWTCRQGWRIGPFSKLIRSSQIPSE